MASRFQVLLTTMMHEADTSRLLVKTCVLLHNLMKTRHPVMQNRPVDLIVLMWSYLYHKPYISNTVDMNE